MRHYVDVAMSQFADRRGQGNTPRVAHGLDSRLSGANLGNVVERHIREPQHYVMWSPAKPACRNTGHMWPYPFRLPDTNTRVTALPAHYCHHCCGRVCRESLLRPIFGSVAVNRCPETLSQLGPRLALHQENSTEERKFAPLHLEIIGYRTATETGRRSSTISRGRTQTTTSEIHSEKS